MSALWVNWGHETWTGMKKSSIWFSSWPTAEKGLKSNDQSFLFSYSHSKCSRWKKKLSRLKIASGRPMTINHPYWTAVRKDEFAERGDHKEYEWLGMRCVWKTGHAPSSKSDQFPHRWVVERWRLKMAIWWENRCPHQHTPQEVEVTKGISSILKYQQLLTIWFICKWEQ